MVGEFGLLSLLVSVFILIVFAAMAILMLYMMFRAWRAPRLYYPPPPPSASVLVKELMCPKCSSKDLEPVGYYTIRCKSCGFTFSVGREAVYPYYPGWWFWPMLWLWPLFWIWPITWLEKE